MGPGGNPHENHKSGECQYVSKLLFSMGNHSKARLEKLYDANVAIKFFDAPLLADMSVFSPIIVTRT